MSQITRRIILVCCVLSLSACMLDGTSNQSWGQLPDADPGYLYPESYSNIDTQEPKQTTVLVPQTYHMRDMSSPTPAKDEDKHWVQMQNPSAYTLEVAADNKASRVATTLYKIPKTQRSAEIQSNDGLFHGVYGSFDNLEAAEAERNALPDDIKQKTNIKTWQKVQQSL